MADDAIAKILDEWKAVLEASPALAGETIRSDLSPDEALDGETDLPVIVIYTEAWDFDQSPYQGQTHHSVLINFERIESSANVGVVSRSNSEILAEVIKVIHANRTLGGRLESVEEQNIAPPGSDFRKSIAGASLQTIQHFYTPRGDHFTIVGQGGATF